MMTRLSAARLIAFIPFCLAATADDLPGYMAESRADEILAKTLRIDLAPSLSGLSDAERAALPWLLAAGQRFHTLYLRQKHHQAIAARDALADLRLTDTSAPLATKLQALFRLAKGPVITTLANQRVPFVPADMETPGRNVYPIDLAEDELTRYLDANRHRRAAMLAERTVVRRASVANIAHYRSVLDAHPALELLHTSLRQQLATGTANNQTTAFLAVPYAVEYADDVMAIYAQLNSAANILAAQDKDFAAYLRNRARDLLSDDYESGDASWVTGRFGNLNAQIGSYETYDDKLFGVKSFFSMSLLVRDEPMSRQLDSATSAIQKIENALPYDAHKRVRPDIPVGVYNVVADFGQSRGGNTATILPNDANFSRKYGRTILLRYNIMTHPDLFRNTWSRYAAATVEAVRQDLTSEALFNRTLFHEIGHYLGVDETRDGRSLDVALGSYSDLFEEMKSDLVALFATPILAADDYYTVDGARSVYAAGVSRTLQVIKPRRDQPYQTMQLMQFNYFLENGVLGIDDASGGLMIDYDAYPLAVERLLRKTLALQSAGDSNEASAFVDRWGYWRNDLHEVLAGRMRDSIKYRYTLVTYAAEPDVVAPRPSESGSR